MTGQNVDKFLCLASDNFKEINTLIAGGTLADLEGLLVIVSATMCHLVARLLQERKSKPTGGRGLSIKDAARLHPVSRSMLYERGEELGLVHTPQGTHKKIVDEDRLQKWLSGRH
jgi:hypothetical protein